jgi:hypothetical protein
MNWLLLKNSLLVAGLWGFGFVVAGRSATALAKWVCGHGSDDARTASVSGH